MKMRRIVIALFVLTLISGLCFAQETKAPAKPVAAAPAVVQPVAAAPAVAQPTAAANEAGTMSAMGAVDSVTVADAAKGTKSEIIVSDDAGKKTSFLVKMTTTIYDTDWKPLTLDKVTKGEKVKVRYSTTKEGVEEAVSVNVVK